MRRMLRGGVATALAAAISAPSSETDLFDIGASKVTLEYLTLTGGYFCVRVDRAEAWALTNSRVFDNHGAGIYATGDAPIVSNGSTISGINPGVRCVVHCAAQIGGAKINGNSSCHATRMTV